MIPPFCGRKPTGGPVGVDLPLSMAEPRGESIAEVEGVVRRGRVDV